MTAEAYDSDFNNIITVLEYFTVRKDEKYCTLNLLFYFMTCSLSSSGRYSAGIQIVMSAYNGINMIDKIDMRVSARSRFFR
jgi:hypothetical protein